MTRKLTHIMFGIGRQTRQQTTVEVRLTFIRKELIYDLRQLGYVEGDVTLDNDPDARHRRHQTQDIAEQGNADIITRVLDTAFEECVHYLLAFAKINVEDGDSMDDRLVPRSEYIAALNVPSDYSRTTMGLLSKKIHDYMVYRALWLWLSITNPQAAGKWKELYELTAEDIKETRFADGCVKRPFYPAW